MAGIYIHIPFCKLACYYCDFHFSTNSSNKELMVKAILEELLLQKDYLNDESIRTIYFGGGTPSLLSEEELNLILNTLYKYYNIELDVEITFEANPDDLTLETLKSFKNIGINRLSLGIQSFDNTVLKFLNRPHSAEVAIQSFLLARQAGFSNVSVDLIYAIPGQAPEVWKKNIQQALDLNPEHISSYALTIENKTVFGNWYAAGKLKPVEDDLAALQLEILVDKLELSGYEQYEVSNFSKSGFYSKHNSSYWKQEKYLGIGPSAHSYNKETRQFNIRNNQLYINSILKDGKIPYEREVLSRADLINEYLLTTLRTSWGCNLKFLIDNFNYDLSVIHESYLKSLIDNQCASLENYCLKLTKRGKLLADKISSDLFLIT